MSELPVMAPAGRGAARAQRHVPRVTTERGVGGVGATDGWKGRFRVPSPALTSSCLSRSNWLVLKSSKSGSKVPVIARSRRSKNTSEAPTRVVTSRTLHVRANLVPVPLDLNQSADLANNAAPHAQKRRRRRYVRRANPNLAPQQLGSRTQLARPPTTIAHPSALCAERLGVFRLFSETPRFAFPRPFLSSSGPGSRVRPSSAWTTGQRHDDTDGAVRPTRRPRRPALPVGAAGAVLGVQRETQSARATPSRRLRRHVERVPAARCDSGTRFELREARATTRRRSPSRRTRRT